MKQVPAKQEQHTESFEEEATIYLQDASMLKFTSNIISEDKSRHINGIEYIDLGLSVLWANRNFGAKYPYETGIYVDKEDDATTSKICEWNFNGSMIPTIAQFEELRTKCSWIRARQKNIEGFAVRGRNGKEIFVPYSKSAMGLSINTYGNFFTKESFYKDSYINYYMYYGTSGYKLTKYASKLICPIRLVAPKN